MCGIANSAACPAQPSPFHPAPTYQHHQVGLLPPGVRERRRRNREIAGREKQEGNMNRRALRESQVLLLLVIIQFNRTG